MNGKLKIFLKGVIDVSPLMIPVVPFGLIFGVLAIDVGFTPMETMGMSLIIFGGASQIVLLQLFSGGASSLVIISSVGAVNSRHLLYGAVVSEHLSDLKLIWKIIISYFLIDQAFARSNEYFKKNKDVRKYEDSITFLKNQLSLSSASETRLTISALISNNPLVVVTPAILTLSRFV